MLQTAQRRDASTRYLEKQYKATLGGGGGGLAGVGRLSGEGGINTLPRLSNIRVKC